MTHYIFEFTKEQSTMIQFLKAIVSFVGLIH